LTYTSINCQLNDSDDVRYRCSCFIGQYNIALCYFNELDLLVRIKLSQNFVCMFVSYGHWQMKLLEFFVAWWKSLRRVLIVLNLPYDSNSYLLSLLSGTLPVFIEICKRSARFISYCMKRRSILV
jgi:hypothetical protein